MESVKVRCEARDGDCMSVTSSLLVFPEVYKAVNLPFKIRSPSLETLHRLAYSVDVMSAVNLLLWSCVHATIKACVGVSRLGAVRSGTLLEGEIGFGERRWQTILISTPKLEVEVAEAMTGEPEASRYVGLCTVGQCA